MLDSKSLKSLSLDKINASDLYYIASALIFALHDDSKYTTTSELFYILDYENFIKLIKYYGGQTIKIPTSEEISDILKLLLLYQYYKIDKMSWNDAIKRAGLEDEPPKSVTKKLASIENKLGDLKIGKRNYR